MCCDHGVSAPDEREIPTLANLMLLLDKQLVLPQAAAMEDQLVQREGMSLGFVELAIGSKAFCCES